MVRDADQLISFEHIRISWRIPLLLKWASYAEARISASTPPTINFSIDSYASPGFELN